MTVLDWVLVVVWSGITLGGFFKGAIRIVFGFGGLALGLWSAAVLCLLAGWGMERTLEALKLGCLNRLLGAALAGAAAAVVLAVLLLTAVGLSPEVAALGERSVVLARVRAAVERMHRGQDAPVVNDDAEEAGEADGESSSSGR